MCNPTRASVLAASLALLGLGVAQAQTPAPQEPAQSVVVVAKKDQSSWVRAESAHLVVYSDADDDDVFQLVENLERLDHVLRIYTLHQPQAQTQAPEPKLTLYFHRKPSDLRAVDDGLPAGALGRYSSCAGGVQGDAVHIERIASLADEQLDKGPLNDDLSLAFEAYARHFLYRHTDIRTPASFIEGYAQYFSSVRFSEQQMVVGRVPKGLGDYLGFLDQGNKYSLEYEDVLQQSETGSRGHGGAAGVRLEYAAKAWLLVHHMLSTPEQRKRLNRFLALTSQGLAVSPAFERAFGLKAADLGETLWRYRRKGLQALRVAMPALPKARVSVRRLPREADEFALADAALKACPGRAAGEALLSKLTGLAGQHPASDLARLSLSRAQIDWGRAEDALPQLQAVLRRDEDHAEARYLLGKAYLRLAERHDGEARRADLQAARQHLQRARAADRLSPEVALAVFRAEVAASRAPSKAELQAVIAAWQTAREVAALNRAAALAYAYQGRGNDAIAALDALAQNARDEPNARWARQWQSRLEAGVSLGDILAEMRQGLSAELAFKEWTYDKDEAMQAVRLSSGLESAAGFIAAQQRKDAEARSQPAGPNGSPR